MKIECYMSLRCGSEEPLRENLRQAAALEGVEAKVLFRRVSDEEAAALGLRGSPSVFINGNDIDPQDIPGFA
jgi:hypothetical protein